MANNEEKTAAEKALKRMREQALTGKNRVLKQSPADRYGIVSGGQQERTLRAQEKPFFPPGISMLPSQIADPIVRQKHRMTHPDEVGSNLGLMGGEPYKESVQRPAYVKPSDRETSKPTAASADVADIKVRSEGVEDVKVRAAEPASKPGALTGEYATGDPLGTSGFTAQVSGGRGRPLTRYEDGKGGFMEAKGTRKGGGTVSVMSGPGSNDYTKEEWGKMSGKERTQANVDSYKAQTQAIRDSMAKPRQRGTASGGALTGQQSPFERRKTLREYRMAAGNLKDDMRRGRVSAKKGKIIAATLADHYNKALGGDLQELMKEGVRQEGRLMAEQEQSAGALDVAQEQGRNAAPEFIKPLGYEIEQGDAYGGSPYVLNRDTGETRTLGPSGQTTMDPAKLEALQQGDRAAIEALPEEQRAAAIAKFEGRYNVGY